MGNIFSGREIVELGIQIEKNGRDFYEGVSKKAKDLAAKDKFIYLAKQEEEHIQVFQNILEKTPAYDPAESYSGEYLAYMKALASEHIFTKENKGKEVAGNIKNEREAIDLAIGFEKESIIFYGAMKKTVAAEQLNILDELIKQEQGHLAQLAEIKSKI